MMRAVSDYRRNFVPGGSFFFTVNLADRHSQRLIESIDSLRRAFRHVRARHPFTLDAIVVMPEHLHAIWTLPVGDADYSTRWQLIKAVFSRGIEAVEQRSKSRAAKDERGIWQRRYWEHTLRDESDFARHCDYIHFNPVKHGYVRTAHEWPYSSLHRFVKLGICPLDWASGADSDGSGFGER
jgi:putative transposase